MTIFARNGHAPYDDDKVADLINRTLQEKPDTASAWSVGLMAQAQGVSKSPVQRWFSLSGAPSHPAYAAAGTGLCRRLDP